MQSPIFHNFSAHATSLRIGGCNLLIINHLYSMNAETKQSQGEYRTPEVKVIIVETCSIICESDEMRNGGFLDE